MKQVLSGLLAALLCLGLFAGVAPRAAAAEDAESQATQICGTVTLDDADQPSNDELFDEYLRQMILLADPSMEHAFDSRSVPDHGELTATDVLYLQALKPEIAKIANGTRTDTQIMITYESVGGVRFDTTYSQRFYEALKRECVYELYWQSDTIGFATSNTAAYFKLYVADAFADANDPNKLTIDVSKVQTAQAAVQNALQIVEENRYRSDLSKLFAYRDAICDLTDYNSAAASQHSQYTDVGNWNPWQMIWVFDGDPETKVVCEGYSKAFQFLCDQSSFSSPNINCYCVSGSVTWSNSGGGGHMWNIVTMDDGKNYLVDVTNCDGNWPRNIRFLKHATSGSVADGYYIDTGDYYLYYPIIKQIFSENALTLSGTNYYADSYYLVGTMNSWTPDLAYKLTQSGTNPEEYTIVTDLAATDHQFKIVYSADGENVQTWYPDGTDNNYGQNGEIPADGTYRIRFRPNGDGGGDWFYNIISATRLYVVTLDPGEGEGRPIVITSEDDGAWAESFRTAAPGQFFPDGNHDGFKIPNCPDTFTKDGCAFAGWRIGTNNRLCAPDDFCDAGSFTLTAQWAQLYSITYASIDPEIASWNRFPDEAGAGSDVYVEIQFADGACEAGYRLSEVFVTYGEEVIRITEDLSYLPLVEVEYAAIVMFPMPSADVTVTPVFTQVLTDGYFLIGPDGWTVNDIDLNQKFKENPNTQGEYMLATTLAENDPIKVVHVSGGAIDAWYPDGLNNEYTVDASHAGPVTISFNPNKTNGWSILDGYADIKALRVANHSLSLDGKIGVNFYMSLPDGYNYTGSKMTFAITHGTCTEEVAFDPMTTPTDVNGNYRFTCYVNSIQMAETITATFSYHNADGAAQTLTDAFRVVDYFTYFDTHPDEFTNANINNLIKAFANYGYYVQHFLEAEKTTWSFEDNNYIEMVKNYESINDQVTALQSGYTGMTALTKTGSAYFLDSGITYSLVLDSATAINVFFTPVSSYTAEPSVAVTWYHSDSQQTESLVKDQDFTLTRVGSRWRVQILNIMAQDLDKMFTITLNDGGGDSTTGATVTVSALCYVRSMMVEANKEGFNHNATAIQWKQAAAAIKAYNDAANTVAGN